MNTLKLVYPPISNQYAEWIKDDPEIKKYFENSHLYMIVQRAEARFSFSGDNPYENINENSFSLKLQLIVEDIVDDFEIDLLELYRYHEFDEDKYDVAIEIGEKQIRFWKCEQDTKKRIDVINWFTTEKILWDKWNKHPAIIGLDKVDIFSRFYLHYVGISKKEDSLTRLVVKPHDKRLRILSNERNISDTSRLTDEIILLFFRIEDLKIQIWDEDFNFDFLEGRQIDNINVIADAEKAFINILNSKYNQQKYQNYPKGKDGLYYSGLNGYSYSIGEELTLITETNEINGQNCPFGLYEQADTIVIQGSEVSLYKNIVS